MDCCVLSLPRHKGLFLAQTVDFFYPLINDPFALGKIALANVVSDIYAIGLTEIDDLSMIISSPSTFDENERDVIVPMIMNGFLESAKAVNCKVQIRNIISNPWCIVGGCASSVCTKEKFITPTNAEVGDVLILTKPLGTQLATNVFIWMDEDNDKYKKLLSTYSRDDIIKTYKLAVETMTTLNKNAANLMHKYNAHAGTDVTGFGLLGHAENLAEFQINKVSFQIERLPIIKNVLQFSRLLNMETKLISGKAVETSGGLLICVPAENAQKFCIEYETLNQGRHPAWVIGKVIDSVKNPVVIVADPEFIEVDFDL